MKKSLLILLTALALIPIYAADITIRDIKNDPVVLRAEPEQDLASATTTTLAGINSQTIRITGTTTITSFGAATAGLFKHGRFSGALQLTHSANLILPGLANITTAANDRWEAWCLSTGVWIVNLWKADGTAIVGGAGGGDLSSNTSSSVDGEVMLFSGTAGKTAKRSTLTATVTKMTSGVPSAATAETDYVTPSGAGTLANKTLTTPVIGSMVNATHTHANAAGGGQLTATSALSATGTPSSSTYLRGDNTWNSPAGSGDVTAASSFGTDNRLVRSDGTGKGVQSSGITVDDSDNVTVPGGVTAASFTGTGTTANSRFDAPDDDASAYAGFQAADTTTTSVNMIFPAAPTSGLVKTAVTGTTNWTFSAAVADTDYVAPGGNIAAGTATTASANDSSTKIATTAYTQAELTAYASDAVTFTNKKISGSTLGSDDTYTGIDFTGLNNSGGVTQWDAVYLNGSSQWVLADANGSGTYPCRGLAVATVAGGGSTTVIMQGVARNDAWTWTPGGTIYLSTTAGGLTQTAPSTTGDKVQTIGFAIDADTMRVFPSGDYGTAP